MSHAAQHMTGKPPHEQPSGSKQIVPPSTHSLKILVSTSARRKSTVQTLGATNPNVQPLIQVCVAKLWPSTCVTGTQFCCSAQGLRKGLGFGDLGTKISTTEPSQKNRESKKGLCPSGKGLFYNYFTLNVKKPADKSTGLVHLLHFQVHVWSGNCSSDPSLLDVLSRRVWFLLESCYLCMNATILARSLQ